MAVCLAVAVVAWLATGGAGNSSPHGDVRAGARGAGTVGAPTRTPGARPDPARRLTPAQLAADLNRAEQTIDDRRASVTAIARAALLEQLATDDLGRAPARQRRATLALADRAARATLQTNLAAAAALTGLAEHRARLPPWRIVAPPAAATLQRFFRGAQARYHVPWVYLAAIMLVESQFGRIRGPSPAGAQGPMQFLPATWSEYGHGSINDPRAATLAAARYLAANGAPGDMADALFHYNNSPEYVAAVRDYARRMQRDPRAYLGYYDWQVVYTYDHHTVILPVGFPAERPVPLRAARGLPPLPPVR